MLKTFITLTLSERRFCEGVLPQISLPKRFGNWHAIHTRMNRKAKAGARDRLFDKLQEEQLIRSD